MNLRQLLVFMEGVQYNKRTLLDFYNGKIIIPKVDKEKLFKGVDEGDIEEFNEDLAELIKEIKEVEPQYKDEQLLSIILSNYSPMMDETDGRNVLRLPEKENRDAFLLYLRKRKFVKELNTISETNKKLKRLFTDFENGEIEPMSFEELANRLFTDKIGSDETPLNYTKIWEGNGWLIANPLDFQTSVKLSNMAGKTSWCTASDKSYFDSYTKKGPLYYFINEKKKLGFNYHRETIMDRGEANYFPIDFEGKSKKTKIGIKDITSLFEQDIPPEIFKKVFKDFYDNIVKNIKFMKKQEGRNISLKSEKVIDSGDLVEIRVKTGEEAVRQLTSIINSDRFFKAHISKPENIIGDYLNYVNASEYNGARRGNNLDSVDLINNKNDTVVSRYEKKFEPGSRYFIIKVNKKQGVKTIYIKRSGDVGIIYQFRQDGGSNRHIVSKNDKIGKTTTKLATNLPDSRSSRREVAKQEMRKDYNMGNEKDIRKKGEKEYFFWTFGKSSHLGANGNEKNKDNYFLGLLMKKDIDGLKKDQEIFIDLDKDDNFLKTLKEKIPSIAVRRELLTLPYFQARIAVNLKKMRTDLPKIRREFRDDTEKAKNVTKDSIKDHQRFRSYFEEKLLNFMNVLRESQS